MIRFHDKQPEGVTDIAHHDCDLWIEGRDDVGTYAYVGVQIMETDCSVHFEVVRFTGVVLKQMIDDWEVVKKKLSSRGVQNVVATNWEKDAGHWSRFIGYFGFGEPRVCLVSRLSIGGS